MAEAVIPDIASFVTESTIPDAAYEAAGPPPPTTVREQWIQSVTLHKTPEEIVVNLVGAVYDHRIMAKADSRELERRLHARLDQWGDGITSRVDGLEVRLSALDQRFDRMDQRFDRMDQRFDRMDRRLSALDQRFDRMEARTDLMDQMLANRLTHLEEKVVLLVKDNEDMKSLLKDFISEVRNMVATMPGAEK